VALPHEVAARFCIHIFHSNARRSYLLKDGGYDWQNRQTLLAADDNSLRITLALEEMGNTSSQFLHHWYFYQFFRLQVLAMLSATWIGKAGAKKIK
jgi:hypothetical protein